MNGERRRVLVLNHYAAPRAMAGGTRHVELFDRLSGWEYKIVASNLNPQTGARVTTEKGLIVVPVRSYSTNGLTRILNWVSYAIGAVIVGLKQRRVDVVYGSSPHLLAPFAAWAIAAIKRKPFVLEVRDLWPRVLVEMGALDTRSFAYRVLSCLEDFLYRRADRIVVMAWGVRAALLDRGVPEWKLWYIPNGADPEDFVPPKTRHELRSDYGFDRATAVYAGAHGPANGLDYLLDAAAEVTDLPIDIVLVGGGVEKQRLMRVAAERQLRNVRFLDPIPKDEMSSLLGAADVGLHVLADVEFFRAGVSPNKLYDYMAAGLPVITNCPGVVGDVVQDAGAGLVVPPLGIAEALRAIMGLIDTERLQEMGRGGRDWIGINQSRSAMAARLEQMLGELT